MVKFLPGQDGVDPNVSDRTGWTALHWALHWKHTEMIKLLLSTKGVDVNARDVDGRSPLLLACNNRDPEIINMLLDMPGIQADARSVHGASPLSAAARRVNRLLMKRLIQAGANPNEQSKREICHGIYSGRLWLFGLSWS